MDDPPRQVTTIGTFDLEVPAAGSDRLEGPQRAGQTAKVGFIDRKEGFASWAGGVQIEDGIH
ncbi:MAG TPA: hypothetical protein VGO93_29995 [Candidatus Xenobia bacterium]